MAMYLQSLWTCSYKSDFKGGQGPHSHRHRVQNCNCGQDFWPSKNGLDCLTMPDFCPWPLAVDLLCMRKMSATPLGRQVVTAIVPQHSAWPFDQPPESALTVWLHLDPSRSSGHGAYGSDPPLETWVATLTTFTGHVVTRGNGACALGYCQARSRTNILIN